MNIEEARLYLEHTSKDDFNLEEHQKENRYQAIQVVLKEIERLNNDIKELLKENSNKEKVIKAQDNIIKEVRGKLYDLNYKIKEIHNVPFDISEIFEIIEILDKEKE